MTTGVVCGGGGGGIKSKPRALYSRMDPRFIQLESQLAALRNQRHPTIAAGTRFATTTDAPATSRPPPTPKRDVPPARKSDPSLHPMASESLSSLSSFSLSSLLALSQDGSAAMPQSEYSACSPPPSSSSSLPSSSSSVDSATANDKRDSPSESQQTPCGASRQSLTTPTSEFGASSEQRQSNAVVARQQSSSSVPSAAVAVGMWGARRRSAVPSISEERSRFRIVKIDSYVDRGRWHCHNFADPPMHDSDVGPSAQDDSPRAPGDSDFEPAPPSQQIYYIAAAGRNDDEGDPSKKFYVSMIVYGEHGHPVLDRTVEMSRRQLLGRAGGSGDDALPGETLTPTARESDDRNRKESPSNRVGETEDKILTTCDRCDDVSLLPVDKDGGHAASAPETRDVTEIDAMNPTRGVAMATDSSIPSILTTCCPPQPMTSVSDYDDDASRCPVTSLSACQQDDAQTRCHDDSLGRPTRLTQQLLLADERHSTSVSGGGTDACSSSSSSSSSTCSIVALDTKIEQAMELVKSHLMFAVREEVNGLKARIDGLSARNARLQMENALLRQHASTDTLAHLQQRTCSPLAAEHAAPTPQHQ